MMNSLLRCLVATPVLAGLTACMPNPEPVDRSTVTTGTSAMNTSNTSNTNATANRTANAATPAATPTPAPTPQAMTADEKKAVAELQWLNGADAARDARNELAQAKAQDRKPSVMAFARRGLSYPGLGRAQMAKIRRKVNDRIVEGSGDMIFGQAHREMRQKLRTYAIAYNQAIAASF